MISPLDASPAHARGQRSFARRHPTATLALLWLGLLASTVWCELVTWGVPRRVEDEE